MVLNEKFEAIAEQRASNDTDKAPFADTLFQTYGPTLMSVSLLTERREPLADKTKLQLEKPDADKKPVAVMTPDAVATYATRYGEIFHSRDRPNRNDSIVQEFQAAFQPMIDLLDARAVIARRDLPALTSTESDAQRLLEEHVSTFVDRLTPKEVESFIQATGRYVAGTSVQGRAAQTPRETLRQALEIVTRHEGLGVRQWPRPEEDGRAGWDQMAGWVLRNRPDLIGGMRDMWQRHRRYLPASNAAENARQAIQAPAAAVIRHIEALQSLRPVRKDK